MAFITLKICEPTTNTSVRNHHSPAGVMQNNAILA